MKRIIRICMAVVGTGVVCSALGIGAWWCVSAFPAPQQVAEDDVGPGRSEAALRPAEIPWARDPDHLETVFVSYAWLPGERPPKGGRPTRGGSPVPLSLPRARVDPSELASIDQAFAAGKEDQIQQALRAVDRLIGQNPIVAANHLRSVGMPWCKALLDAHRFDDLDRLTEKLLVPCAFDTRLLEALLIVRWRTATLAGRDQQALQTARQLFAICPLYDTNRIVSMLLPVIVKGKQKGFANELRAALQGESAPTNPGLSLQLAPDGADASMFAQAERENHAEDYGTLIARGNLLLLAARPDAAERLFRRAYMMVPPGDVESATENFARCAKARTGTIGSANAWLKAHAKEHGQ